MKKLGNAILMIDIPFNIAGIILCMCLVLNIICAVGRARHKESMIAEGMTGISFLIKIMCIIFWAVYRLFL